MGGIGRLHEIGRLPIRTVLADEQPALLFGTGGGMAIGGSRFAAARGGAA